MADSNRPERRTTLVYKGLARLNIDVAALSETRVPKEGNIKEAGRGTSSSQKERLPKNHVIQSQLVQQHNFAPTVVSEHLMTVRISLSKGRHTLISVYAPTLSSNEEDKATSYTQIEHIIQTVPANDKLVVLGDFNARVGRDHWLWEDILAITVLGIVVPMVMALVMPASVPNMNSS